MDVPASLAVIDESRPHYRLAGDSRYGTSGVARELHGDLLPIAAPRPLRPGAVPTGDDIDVPDLARQGQEGHLDAVREVAPTSDRDRRDLPGAVWFSRASPTIAHLVSNGQDEGKKPTRRAACSKPCGQTSRRGVEPQAGAQSGQESERDPEDEQEHTVGPQGTHARDRERAAATDARWLAPIRPIGRSARHQPDADDHPSAFQAALGDTRSSAPASRAPLGHGPGISVRA